MISKVKCTTPEQLDVIIATAKSSQKEWRKKSVEERVDILKDCIKELTAVSDEMIQLIVQEMGKPIAEAKEEMEYAVNDQDEYFNILLESIKPKKYGKSTVVRHPYGVVAIMR
jgi:acyl-CoA reductase-like NAD-dependent aldehyde dehydrogenase